MTRATSSANNPKSGEQPWLANPAWAKGEIASENSRGVWGIGIFALFWNGLTWTIATQSMRDFFSSGDKKILLVLLFPAIGLGLLGIFVYLLLQHRKYGVAKFRMLSVPGVLGGTLRGAIEVPVQVDPPEGFKLRLLCVQRRTSGSRKNRSTTETVQWEDEKLIRKDLLEHDRTRTGIPVFFNIPFDLPEPTAGNPAVIWRLKVEADVPGIDFAATFSVPVYQTPDSRSDGEQEPDPTLAYQPVADEYRWPADSPIRLTERGDSLEVYSPPAQNKGLLLFLFFFCALWNGAIVLMVKTQAPLVFPLVAGFFDLILLAVLFSMLFHSVRVEASSGGLKIRTRFILPTSTRNVPPGEIAALKVMRGMTSGDTVWYDIHAIGKGNRRYSLASGIPGKRQSAWLAGRIADRVGIDFQD